MDGRHLWLGGPYCELFSSSKPGGAFWQGKFKKTLSNVLVDSVLDACGCRWRKLSEDGSQGESLLLNELFVYCWPHRTGDECKGNSEVLVLLWIDVSPSFLWQNHIFCFCHKSLHAVVCISKLSPKVPDVKALHSSMMLWESDGSFKL